MRKLKLFSLALMALFAMTAWGASTTIFTFTVNNSGSDLTVARKGESLALTTSNAFSTLSGGTVTAVNANTNSGGPDKMVGSDNSERHIRFTATTQYLTLVLSSALAEGDTIVFTGNGSAQIAFTLNTTRSTTISTTSNTYVIPKNSTLIDATTIYVWPSSTSTKIKTFSIKRPATMYTVTINPNGGDYASTPTGWTKNAGVYTQSVAEGSSVSVPAGLTKAESEISGWQDGQGNTITLPITITQDTTLIAQWQAHETSTDATLKSLSVAGCTLNKTFDPDEEDYTITLASCFSSMPVVEDVTATKNDEFAEDPVVTITDNIITISCEAESGATKTYTITVSAPSPTELVSISASTVWDWTSVTGSQTSSPVDANTYYNVKDAEGLGISFANTFNASALMIRGARVKNSGSSAQICGMKFHPTVTGKVYVVAANTGSNNKERWIKYGNDTISIEYKGTTPSSTDTVAVPADVDVELLVTTNNLNVSKIGFIQTFAINCAATENGSVSAGKSLAAAGDTATLTATPATGYELATLKVLKASDDSDVTESVLEGNVLTMPAYAVKVVATFSAIDYTITIDDEIVLGTVEADKVKANYGETVTLTVTPNTSCVISSVTLNGTPLNPVESVYSFEMPAENVEVSATFAAIPYVVTYDANGGTCATESQTFAGTALTLPEATNSPKYFAGWYDDAEAGNKIGMNGDAYIPTANITLYAHWSDTPTAIENQESKIDNRKFIKDGQLFIEKNGHVYNVFGAFIK